jgi:hypothetical protein
VSRTLVTFASQVALAKRDIFDLCDAFATSEALFRRLGLVAEADRLCQLIEALEGRLSEPYPSALASVSDSSLASPLASLS